MKEENKTICAGLCNDELSIALSENTHLDADGERVETICYVGRRPVLCRMDHASFQCIELSSRMRINKHRWIDERSQVRTYHEGLVEGEHDDELDGQELGERLAALKFVLGKPVKYEQTV